MLSEFDSSLKYITILATVPNKKKLITRIFTFNCASKITASFNFFKKAWMTYLM